MRRCFRKSRIPAQAHSGALSCSIQKRNAVCVQKRNSTAGQVLGIQAAAKFGFAGFFALELAPAGACRAAEAARPAVCQAPDGAWVASPQSPILRRSDSIFVPSPGTDNKKQPTGLIIPLLTAQTCPLLIAPPQRIPGRVAAPPGRFPDACPRPPTPALHQIHRINVHGQRDILRQGKRPDEHAPGAG